MSIINFINAINGTQYIIFTSSLSKSIEIHIHNFNITNMGYTCYCYLQIQGLQYLDSI
jgi:hypothetical protein